MQLFLLALLCLWATCQGFYIPGVAPSEYNKGDLLDIRVTLAKKQLKNTKQVVYTLFNAHHVNHTGCEDDQCKDTVTL